jgi:hypothetical protein
MRNAECGIWEVTYLFSYSPIPHSAFRIPHSALP